MSVVYKVAPPPARRGGWLQASPVMMMIDQ